jgi:hypothetical protein
MKEYSNRRNLNRGYMKLDVWQKAVELYKVMWETLTSAKIDLKINPTNPIIQQSNYP